MDLYFFLFLYQILIHKNNKNFVKKYVYLMIEIAIRTYLSLQNKNETKWRPMAISNPSTRLRMARNMPQWVVSMVHA